MNQIGYIPRTLDKLEQFLFWEADQFIIAVMIIGVGVSSGMMVGGLLCGFAAAWHSKFAVHSLYWWLPSKMLFKTNVIPTSDIRYFLG
jgi:conjugal transfer pilus assembly protein TraL